MKPGSIQQFSTVGIVPTSSIGNVRSTSMQLSRSDRRLEEEAYANQDDPEIGTLLLKVHCRS